VLCSDKTGKDTKATTLDGEVVIPATKLNTAHLYDVQSPSLRPETRHSLRKRDDSMGNAVELQVARLRGLVVKDEHGALARREVVFECQYLAPVTERILSEQAKF
jgi:hypothetical protein